MDTIGFGGLADPGKTLLERLGLIQNFMVKIIVGNTIWIAMDPFMIVGGLAAGLYAARRGYRKALSRKFSYGSEIQKLEEKIKALDEFLNLKGKNLKYDVARALGKDYPIKMPKRTSRKFLFFKSNKNDFSPESWAHANRIKLEGKLNVLREKESEINPYVDAAIDALTFGGATGVGLYALKRIFGSTPSARSDYLIDIPDYGSW